MFKYIIIDKKHIKTHEKFLPYFLGNTKEEAERVNKAFSGTLGVISHNYAVATGLEKLDLFEEALVGLARAVRDFDPERGKNFKTYAIYRIKDALRTYVREFKSVVVVPAYLENARRYLSKIKSGCAKSVPFLERIAERAGITLETLIERVELLPSEIKYDESTLHKDSERIINAALLVRKLKKHMKSDEIQICNMIMEGETYKDIGKRFGKTSSWVVYKLKRLRDRIGEEYVH